MIQGCLCKYVKSTVVCYTQLVAKWTKSKLKLQWWEPNDFDQITTY